MIIGDLNIDLQEHILQADTLPNNIDGNIYIIYVLFFNDQIE